MPNYFGMRKLTAWLKRQPFLAEINRRVKARMQEAEAAVSRRKHAVVLTDETSFEELLRRRLGDRPQRLGWPKKRGSLHIFLIYGLNNWEATLPSALAPFGLVSVFEWTGRGFRTSDPDWLHARDVMNAEMLATFEAANANVPVDVVVGYLSGQTVAPEILFKMSQRGAVITNFCLDDTLSFPGRVVGGRYVSTAAIANAVDLNLTSDPNGRAKYSVYGGLAMFHPEAADPQIFFPTSEPFKYPVSFLGAHYGWRPKFIDKLKRRGVDVTCFGQGWPNGSVRTEDMRNIYSASRINLGFGGIGHSQRLLHLKGRDFEVPMSGGLYLTQYNSDLSFVYKLNDEILVYRDVDDCARIIRNILGDAAKAASIRAAGRERALRDHTYLTRWLHVFKLLGAI